MTRRWETAVVAICLAGSGLVALALAFGGTSTYVAIMRDFAPATFHLTGGDATARAVPVDLPTLTGWHNAWFTYVTGEGDQPPISWGAAVFTTAEYAHMADVRNVFLGSRVAAVGAAVVAALAILRVVRRDRAAAVVLVRDAAIAAAIGTAIIAIVAAVAFDPLFLLFHEIFFPQGNFLFPPDSNLIAMYPDPYWYGMTIRIGLAFIVATALIALAATATLRQARR